MLNFREELNKIEQSVKKGRTIEENSEFFLESLINALKCHTYSIGCYHFECLYFAFSGNNLYVKFSENHVSNLLSLNLTNADKVFEFVLNKFKEEKLKIGNESSGKFEVYLD